MLFFFQPAPEDFILKLETYDGRAPKMETAARALALWSDILKAAAEIVEPHIPVSVDLVGVEHGSQLFRAALNRLERFAGNVREGSADFPEISKAAIGLALGIGSIGTTVALTIALTPDPRIPDDQLAVFQRQNELLQESNYLQRKNLEFYGVIDSEPAYKAVKVLRGPDRQVIYEVPQSQFAIRGGLWSIQDAHDAPAFEMRHATWDVTLLKPVLESEPRRWVFARDGIKFSASMTDRRVLQAIKDQTLPIQVAEGQMMRIEVEWRERRVGEAWVPIDRTRRVTRVISPLPPTGALPLLGGTH